MIRVSTNPELLRRACERSDLARDDLATKFKKLPEWEDGETQPTLKQVEAFAHAVHVLVGCLFLEEFPEEPLPISGFRTIADQSVTRPSPNLLDTIYICQERQSWYPDFARSTRQPELGPVASERQGREGSRDGRSADARGARLRSRCRSAAIRHPDRNCRKLKIR